MEWVPEGAWAEAWAGVEKIREWAAAEVWAEMDKFDQLIETLQKSLQIYMRKQIAPTTSTISSIRRIRRPIFPAYRIRRIQGVK